MDSTQPLLFRQQANLMYQTKKKPLTVNASMLKTYKINEANVYARKLKHKVDLVNWPSIQLQTKPYTHIYKTIRKTFDGNCTRITQKQKQIYAC